MAQEQQEQRSAGGAGTWRVAAGSQTQDRDPHGAGLKNPSTVTSQITVTVTSSGFTDFGDSTLPPS